MIHVCFALYDKTGRYSKFTGTAMTSIFKNTASEVTVHILHDDTLPADNRDKFIYIAGRYGQRVKFYNVEVLCADRIAEIKRLFPAANQTRYSIAMFYRFLILKVFPPEVEKVIYLDSDIILIFANFGILSSVTSRLPPCPKWNLIRRDTPSTPNKNI